MNPPKHEHRDIGLMRQLLERHMTDWQLGVFCNDCGCEGHPSCAQSKLAWSPGWHYFNCQWAEKDRR